MTDIQSYDDFQPGVIYFIHHGDMHIFQYDWKNGNHNWRLWDTWCSIWLFNKLPSHGPWPRLRIYLLRMVGFYSYARYQGLWYLWIILLPHHPPNGMNLSGWWTIVTLSSFMMCVIFREQNGKWWTDGPWILGLQVTQVTWSSLILPCCWWISQICFESLYMT